MSNAITIRDDMPLMEMGQVLARSGFFADAREASQAVVKVLAGRELGFGPIASMTGVYIVKGRPALSANLMAAAIKRSGRYTYRVVELSDKVAEIAFFEAGQEIGRSKFTAEDAKRAGTQNMDKFPRNMLFARALSNGARWFCPDIFGGPIYTPEELGASVDEDGEVIDAQIAMAPPPVSSGLANEPTPAQQPPKNGNGRPTNSQQVAAQAKAQQASRGMTATAAAEVKTQKGTLLGTLDREQLTQIVKAYEDEVAQGKRLSEYQETVLTAAKTLLTRASAEHIAAYDKLCEEAEALHIACPITHPGITLGELRSLFQQVQQEIKAHKVADLNGQTEAG
jgi:hypothetical protein